MKYTYIGFIIFLILSVGEIKGQPADSPSTKETIIIDYFSRARGIPYSFVEAVRKQVMNSFIERGRHIVVDAENMDNMELSESEIISHPKAIMGRHPSEEDLRNEAIRSLGANYVISGVVTKYESVRKENSGYVSTFCFSVSSLNVCNGQSTTPEEFKMIGNGRSPEEADERALGRIPFNMIFYIDNHFKFRTEVLRVEAPNDKGKYKELYIHSGSDMGVQNGDLFDVYLETNIGGAVAKTKIGRIRAKEVCGDEVTKCSIKKGGEEMAKAMQNKDRLIVISAGEALF